MPLPHEDITAAWVVDILCAKGGIQDVDDFYVQQILSAIRGQSAFLVIPDSGKNTLFFGLLAALQSLSRAGIAIMVVPSRTAARELVRDPRGCLFSSS